MLALIRADKSFFGALVTERILLHDTSQTAGPGTVLQGMRGGQYPDGRQYVKPGIKELYYDVNDLVFEEITMPAGDQAVSKCNPERRLQPPPFGPSSSHPLDNTSPPANEYRLEVY